MSSELSSDLPELEALERRRVAPSSTNLPLVDEHTTNEEVRALFAEYRERFARTDLPGILLCFATNPALLKGMIQIAEEGLLSVKSVELVTQGNDRHLFVLLTRAHTAPKVTPFCYRRRVDHRR